MYLTLILTVAVIHLLAVMSPGPDFIMISRNALVYSRKVGLYSSVGLGLGILVHVFYSLVGISLIIASSTLLFTVIKLLGAGYLIYLGIKCLKAKPNKTKVQNTNQKKTLSTVAAIRMGFLTNVLNPKASLFFLALFTQVINPDTPIIIQLVIAAEMSLVTMAWFSLIAVLLSHKIIVIRFRKIQHYVERTFGFILIGLGIKVALSSAR